MLLSSHVHAILLSAAQLSGELHCIFIVLIMRFIIMDNGRPPTREIQEARMENYVLIWSGLIRKYVDDNIVCMYVCVQKKCECLVNLGRVLGPMLRNFRVPTRS